MPEDEMDVMKGWSAQQQKLPVGVGTTPTRTDIHPGLTDEPRQPGDTEYAQVSGTTTATATATEEVDYEAMTKAELQDYADAKGYEGVDRDTQNKADMIATIEAAGG